MGVHAHGAWSPMMVEGGGGGDIEMHTKECYNTLADVALTP